MSDTKCRRCGGTGYYSKGNVVNGICFGCGGNGLRRIQHRADRRSGTVKQFVIVDSEGRHLALNTDHASLERLLPTLVNAVEIRSL